MSSSEIRHTGQIVVGASPEFIWDRTVSGEVQIPGLLDMKIGKPHYLVPGVEVQSETTIPGCGLIISNVTKFEPPEFVRIELNVKRSTLPLKPESMAIEFRLTRLGEHETEVGAAVSLWHPVGLRHLLSMAAFGLVGAQLGNALDTGLPTFKKSVEELLAAKADENVKATLSAPQCYPQTA